MSSTTITITDHATGKTLPLEGVSHDLTDGARLIVGTAHTPDGDMPMCAIAHASGEIATPWDWQSPIESPEDIESIDWTIDGRTRAVMMHGLPRQMIG